MQEEKRVTMMAAVAEDTIATGNETVSLSPEETLQERSTEINQHDNNKQQQPAFCEPNENHSNIESTTTTSQTYTDVEDTIEKHVDGDSPHIEDSSSDNAGNGSYFDLFLTAYIPLIILWFRRSMFGPANLIRTIVVGQLMRLVFMGNVSEWISEKLPPWLEVILFPSSAAAATGSGSFGPVSTILGAGSGKLDPHAWPPPAFTALALLTVFALVVHPDGLTWILLGKLRDAIYAVFFALGQSLEFLMNDYGVFPTIIAATTLAAMFFIVFVVIRTLSPKNTKNSSNKHNNTLHSERKKKKKKGGNARHRREHNHHHNHHRSNRIKSSSRSQTGEEIENASTLASPRSPSPMPSLPPSEVQDDALSSPSLPSKDTIDSPINVPSLSAPSPTIATSTVESNERVEQTAHDKVPISNGLNKSKESSRTRRRMMSGSTLDTTPLSDDQSCGSTSVRSFPSVSIKSNRSNNNNNNKGSGSTTPRRVKRHGTVKSPKNPERNSGMKHKSAAMESSVPSRWDALRPEQGNGTKSNTTNVYSSHHANGSTIGKKQSQQQQLQQHPRNNRGNPRRGHGMNGNGKSRKGRQNQKSVATNEPPTPAASIPFASSGFSMRVNNVRSPIAATREQNDGATWSSTTGTTVNPILDSCTASPQSNSNTPAPPPGFRNVSTVHAFEDKQQQQVNNDLLVNALFETPRAMRHENKFSRASETKISPQNNVAVISPSFFPSTGSTRTMIQENPFSNNNNNNNNMMSAHHQTNFDSQIEADLHELGGQMAGSILDF